jgi:hypothetical protein
MVSVIYVHVLIAKQSSFPDERVIRSNGIVVCIIRGVSSAAFAVKDVTRRTVKLSTAGHIAINAITNVWRNATSMKPVKLWRNTSTRRRRHLKDGIDSVMSSGGKLKVRK